MGYKTRKHNKHENRTENLLGYMNCQNPNETNRKMETKICFFLPFFLKARGEFRFFTAFFKHNERIRSFSSRKMNSKQRFQGCLVIAWLESRRLRKKEEIFFFFPLPFQSNPTLLAFFHHLMLSGHSSKKFSDRLSTFGYLDMPSSSSDFLFYYLFIHFLYVYFHRYPLICFFFNQSGKHFVIIYIFSKIIERKKKKKTIEHI